MELDKEYQIYLAMIVGTTICFQWLYHVGAIKIHNFFIPKEYAEMTDVQKSRACSGITSTANAVIMFGWSLYFLLRHNLHEDLCWKDDFYVRLLACVEAGSYFSDTLVLIFGRYEKDTIFYLFHHTAIVFGSYIVVVNRVLGFFFCLRGINELSVPFQHMRVILYDIQWKERKIYLINGLIFLFTFFIARICVIPITLYFLSLIFGTPDFERVNLFCKFVFLGGVVTIDSLNIYWFTLISRGAYKVLVKKKHV